MPARDDVGERAPPPRSRPPPSDAMRACKKKQGPSNCVDSRPAGCLNLDEWDPRRPVSRARRAPHALRSGLMSRAFFEQLSDALAGFLPPDLREYGSVIGSRNVKVWYGPESHEHYEVQSL